MQRIYHRVVVVGQFLAAVLVDMHAKKMNIMAHTVQDLEKSQKIYSI